MTADRLFSGSAQVEAVRYIDLPEHFRRPFEVPSGVIPGAMLEVLPETVED